MNKITILILGMMIATYLPRLIPFLLLGNRKIPKKIEEFLSYIPFAALGSLIIPGVATAIPEHFVTSLVGIIIALLIGYFKGGIVLPILGAIAASILSLGFVIY